jgi:hypothetical protein
VIALVALVADNILELLDLCRLVRVRALDLAATDGLFALDVCAAEVLGRRQWR